MANNKVVYGGTVVMDITDTTAEAADVAVGKDFYDNSGVKRSGSANYMALVTNPTADDILVTDANGQAVDSGMKLADKQDTLVSGTNLKTVNGQSLLGSGNVEVGTGEFFVAEYGDTKKADIIKALNAGIPIYIRYPALSTRVFQAIAVDRDSNNNSQIFLTALIYGKVYEFTVASTKSWSAQTLYIIQEKLVSGTNIKTINNQDIIGAGNIDIPSGGTTYTAGNGIDITNDEISIDTSVVATQTDLSTKADLVPSAVKGEVLITDGSGQPQSSGTDLATLLNDVEAGKEAFMLKDFNQQINITIPSVTQDVANTSIPNMDIDLDVIDPTGELNTKYAIAGLVKYEIYDATSGGNRLNAFPVCSFSMNGQRTLRVRCMVGGPNSKTARRVQGALLLKHR